MAVGSRCSAKSPSHGRWAAVQLGHWPPPHFGAPFHACLHPCCSLHPACPFLLCAQPGPPRPVSAQGSFLHPPPLQPGLPSAVPSVTEHRACSGCQSGCWGPGRSRQTESLPLGRWRSRGKQEKPRTAMCAMSDTDVRGAQDEPGQGSGRVLAKVRPEPKAPKKRGRELWRERAVQRP